MNKKSLDQVLNENHQARLIGNSEQTLPLPKSWKGSIEDFLKQLKAGAADLFHQEYLDIEETFENRIYIGVENQKGQLEYFEVPYSYDVKQGFDFGNPAKVAKKTAWVKAGRNVEQRKSRAINESRQQKLAGLHEERKAGQIDKLTESKQRQKVLAGVAEAREDKSIIWLNENAQGNRYLLIENLYSNLGIIEAKQKGDVTIIKGRAARAEVVTANGRLYPKKGFEKEIVRLGPMLEKGQVLGQIDHPMPEGSGGQLSKTAIKYMALSLDDEDYLCFEGEALGTEAGKTLEALLDGGVSVGMSSRIFANTTKEKRDGREVEIVSEDMEIAGLDAVIDPAVSGAEIQSYS